MWRHPIHRSRPDLHKGSQTRILRCGGTEFNQGVQALQITRSPIKQAGFWMFRRQLHCAGAQKFVEIAAQSRDYRPDQGLLWIKNGKSRIGSEWCKPL